MIGLPYKTNTSLKKLIFCGAIIHNVQQPATLLTQLLKHQIVVGKVLCSFNPGLRIVPD